MCPFLKGEPSCGCQDQHPDCEIWRKRVISSRWLLLYSAFVYDSGRMRTTCPRPALGSAQLCISAWEDYNVPCWTAARAERLGLPVTSRPSGALGQIVTALVLLLKRRLAEVGGLTSEETGSPSSHTCTAKVVLQGVRWFDVPTSGAPCVNSWESCAYPPKDWGPWPAH